MTKQEFEAEVSAEFKGAHIKFDERDDESWRSASVGQIMVRHRGKRARPPGWKVGHLDMYPTTTLHEAAVAYRRSLEQDRDRCNANLAALDAAVGKVSP
jgi:hypothetical protein